MSSSNPRRLVEYGGELRSVLRDALDAERSAAPADAARLSALEQKIALAVAAGPGAGAGAAGRNPGAPKPANPAELPAAGTNPGAPTAPPTAPPTPPTASPPIAAAGKGIAGKGAWALLGVVAVGVGVFALSRAGGTSSSLAPPGTRAPSAALVEVPAADEQAGGGGAPAREAVIPVVSPADLPTVTTPATPPAPAKAPPAAATTTGTTTAAAPPPPPLNDAEEIALLARAHEALRGRPSESLALCAQHESKFAAGHFAEEREAVAIEALVYVNRSEEAQRRFARFEARYPSSAHRLHLESLLPRAPAP